MNKLFRTISAAAILLALSSPALAKLPDKPANELRTKPSQTVVWVAAGIILVGAAGASMKSAKRSHLD